MLLLKEKNIKQTLQMGIKDKEKALTKKIRSSNGKGLKKDKKPKNDLASAEITKSNVFKRTVLTILMIPLFLILVSQHKIFPMLLASSVSIMTFKEVINVMKCTDQERNGLYYKISPWYILATINLYFMKSNVSFFSKSVVLESLISNRIFICFNMCIFGLILFILNLKKGYLKRQFSRFAFIHIVSIVISLSNHAVVMNIEEGRYWFVFPAGLVISNDIFAYIIGKTMGKTPLLKLSPKKTLEGYIGAFIFTIFTGFIFSYLRNNYISFDDKYDNYLKSTINFLSFKIPMIYIHSIPFILFASFIAPFGGFLASGFKRAFKIKDFGDVIPGHGGITDRMDCQFIMGIFTYVYLLTFLNNKESDIGKTFEYICKSYGKKDLTKLVDLLSSYLKE